MEKKRDYSKFFTYPETAKFMVEILKPLPNQVILEPSAGSGNLVKAIKEYQPKTIVIAVELYQEWKESLNEWADVSVIKDFLQFQSIAKFSGCIANPPFGNGIDLDAHINHMRSMVKKGGRLVILVPADYSVDTEHESYPLQNWSKNSDGTTTEIKIISFFNQPPLINRGTFPQKLK